MYMRFFSLFIDNDGLSQAETVVQGTGFNIPAWETEAGRFRIRYLSVTCRMLYH